MEVATDTQGSKADDDDDGVIVVVDSDAGNEGAGGDGRVVGSPCAARAFRISSHPFSSVRIRSLNSSFSRSRARSFSGPTRFSSG